MTPQEIIAAFRNTPTPPVYRFQVGPIVFEHDPVTGRTEKVQRMPLTEDGKTWQKSAEGWVRR